METRKTFKAGTALEDVAAFVKSAADGITGESGSLVLVQTVKVVIATAAAGIPGAVVERLVCDLELGPESVAQIQEFMRYRAEARKKPIRTLRTLARLVAPFKGLPDNLRESIAESMAQSWTGLFYRELKGGGADRKQERGGSNGGTW
jgi:hypothetical protein